MEFKEIVLVEWKDHCHFSKSHWRQRDEIEELTPMTFFTAGVLLKETKDYIIVVSSWDKDEDAYGSEMLILKGDIVKRTKFKIPTK